MLDVVDTTIDLVALALGVGVAFFAFEIRNKFRGGILWRPWMVIGPSPILFSTAQAIHILQEAYGKFDGTGNSSRSLPVWLHDSALLRLLSFQQGLDHK